MQKKTAMVYTNINKNIICNKYLFRVIQNVHHRNNLKNFRNMLIYVPFVVKCISLNKFEVD